MPVSMLKIPTKLSREQVNFLKIFSTSCRRSIIEMTSNAQSGHPGGSLSSIDYLCVLYTQIICHTHDPVIISNGHISPAVYAILAELGAISKKNLLKNFRQKESVFEGHVSRQVPGVWYSTGPLGTGASAATGFALAQKLQKKNKKVFFTLGDGESEEGQVYEMMNFASKYKLDNLIGMVDVNGVQLTGAVKEIMPLHLEKIFTASGWQVIHTDGHNFDSIFSALSHAFTIKNKPVIILADTVMGKGVDYMEKSGKKHEATWHGKASDKEQTYKALEQLSLTAAELKILDTFKKHNSFTPHTETKPSSIRIGKAKIYASGEILDCRTAYGEALTDLASLNKHIIALSADLSSSVKTDELKKKFPTRHIECGIAEQHMLSCAGGLSLSGFVPFVSTFGVFMTSRAKDQARTNDINKTNVKMVATHCGLSVGEDGPTHQALDDIGAFLGHFNTALIEPADANQTQHIIRYIASQWGNFYVRMGRHKLPILTKIDGTPFFDAKYTYRYGKSDILRSGKDITLCVSGSMVSEAFGAYSELQKSHPKISIELVVINSPKLFDETVLSSIQKTKKVITVEDHNTFNGFGTQLARHLITKNISVEKFEMIGVDTYQNSATVTDLYTFAKISSDSIKEKILQFMQERKKSTRTFFFF